MTHTLSELTSCLRMLVRYFEARIEGEIAYLDILTLSVSVLSTLDDVSRRSAAPGRRVPAPDGLFEWRVRRDFVRSIPTGPAKVRLSRTLGGPKTRRRFAAALQAGRPDLVEKFVRHRRYHLRSYAARVIRGFAAEHALGTADARTQS